MSVIHDQKNARHGTWGSSIWGGCDAHIPAHGQGGWHVLSVGESVQFRGGLARLLTLLPNSRGRVATCATRLFHTCVARALLSVEPRQRVGAVLPRRTRLAATFFPLRVLGRSRQFRLVQHVTRQSPDAHEGHVVNASLVRWFNANRHSERYLEPCSLNQGKRLPQ